MATQQRQEQEQEQEEEQREGSATPAASAGGGPPSFSAEEELVLLAPRVREDSVPVLRAQWEGLKLRVQALRPVERYAVRCVVYRRHLADSADLLSGDPDDAAPRWPVAWLFLRPAKFGPRHQLPSQVRWRRAAAVRAPHRPPRFGFLAAPSRRMPTHLPTHPTARPPMPLPGHCGPCCH